VLIEKLEGGMEFGIGNRTEHHGHGGYKDMPRPAHCLLI